jgi:hypothetical protein
MNADFDADFRDNQGFAAQIRAGISVNPRTICWLVE